MNTLSMPPADAVRIGTSCLSLASGDGRTVHFSKLEPFDCHDRGDRPALFRRLARRGVAVVIWHRGFRGGD